MSQTKHLPASRTEWDRGVQTAVMDWRWSQDKAAAAAAAGLHSASAHSQSQPSLCSKPRRHGRWPRVWNSSHNWVDWAFVSWLITADSWLSSPPFALSSLHHPSACSVLLFTSGKGITNDRRRLPNLSSGKTFQSQLSLCPCRAQIASGKKKTHIHNKQQQLQPETFQSDYDLNWENHIVFSLNHFFSPHFLFCLQTAAPWRPSGITWNLFLNSILQFYMLWAKKFPFSGKP